MSLTAISLVSYIAWTLILLISLEVFRTTLVVKHKRAPNTFNSQGDDTNAFGHRLTRAHANCYESFPIIGGILVTALATGNSAITEPLAITVLVARLAQSLLHLYSGSVFVSQLRFLCFLIQLTIASWWIVQLLIALS